MAWIESHQSTGRHPKTKRFAHLLGVDKIAAIGYLHMLWWWALDYAQSGDLSEFTPEEIADGVEWRGEPEAFINALKGARYVDPDDTLHDWYDYAGKLIEQREKDAERKREARAKSKQNKKDVRQTSGGHPTDIQGTSACTVPNQPTKPNQPTTNGGVGELAKSFEQTFGSFMNSVQRDDLLEYMDKGMEVELLIHDMKLAARNGKPFNYALSIVKRQFEEGLHTVAQVEQRESERQAAATVNMSYTVSSGQSKESGGRYIPREMPPEVLAALGED